MQSRIRFAVATVAALATMTWTALDDTARVTARIGLEEVTFGWPPGWLVQDQSALDPPLPYIQGVLSPWEHPTTVSFLPAAASLVLFFALACGALTAVSLAARRLVAALPRRAVSSRG